MEHFEEITSLTSSQLTLFPLALNLWLAVDVSEVSGLGKGLEEWCSSKELGSTYMKIMTMIMK